MIFCLYFIFRDALGKLCTERIINNTFSHCVSISSTRYRSRERETRPGENARLMRSYELRNFTDIRGSRAIIRQRAELSVVRTKTNLFATRGSFCTVCAVGLHIPLMRANILEDDRLGFTTTYI